MIQVRTTAPDRRANPRKDVQSRPHGVRELGRIKRSSVRYIKHCWVVMYPQIGMAISRVMRIIAKESCCTQPEDVREAFIMLIRWNLVPL
jgi:hypothetical protein